MTEPIRPEDVPGELFNVYEQAMSARYDAGDSRAYAECHGHGLAAVLTEVRNRIAIAIDDDRCASGKRGVLMADKQTERAIHSLRERHEGQIRENAERIQEHIGYMIQRVGSGNAGTVGLYAADIAAAAHRIVERVAVLEALADAKGIYDAEEADRRG